MTADHVSAEDPQRRPAREEVPRQAPERLPESPYKGLSYYEQADAPFFFGRERETQVVAANIMASRLTVLYGESGVGKSSLLRAGAARHLMEIAAENVARRGTPRLVVAVVPDDHGAVRTTWRDDPVPTILAAVERAVASLGLDVLSPPPGPDLCAQLTAWTELLGSDLLIVLDQFEEYLLYHEGEDGAGTLAVELPRALLQTNLRVNFLISIREDMLAKLDSFKRRIPTIFDNCVRVKHLDSEHARAAIEKPIGRYNEVGGTATQITIQPPLVDTLLQELQAGRVVVGIVGAGASNDAPRADAQAIETPYLQLVMTRLWKEETEAGSSVLRLVTLERLGHSDSIVKTHLDGTMRTLPRYARYVAARAFHHLVTPSGSKIAHSPGDLAAYAGLDERDIEPVLERLTEPEYRILRRVAATAEDAPARFEIFHDVLGTPILDWRTRYLRNRDGAEIVRSGLTAFVLIVFGLLSIGALCGLAVSYDYSAAGTLWVAWAASAVLIWASTTDVLVQRWQRREAWTVPLVGIAAAAIGPLTAVVFVANRVVQLVSRGRPRVARLPSRDPRSQARAGRSVRRLAGLVSILGAGALVLACLLPAVELTFYGARDLVTTAGNLVTTGRADLVTTERLLESDDRAWFTLLPLACAALAAVAGLLALARPRPRGFLMGVLSGLGISAAAYYFSLLWWTEALVPYVAHAQGYGTYGSPRGGPLLGLGAAGLVLVSAAPLVAVEIFAAIVGAGRVARGTARDASGVDLDRARTAMQVPIAVLGVVGAATGLAASIVESGAWGRPQANSLFDISSWAALQVAVPSLVAAAAAAAIGLGNRVGERAAGCLAGCGVALLAWFAGVFGSSGWHPQTGAYLGVGAGTLLVVAGTLSFADRARTAAGRRALDRNPPGRS